MQLLIRWGHGGSNGLIVRVKELKSRKSWSSWIKRVTYLLPQKNITLTILEPHKFTILLTGIFVIQRTWKYTCYTLQYYSIIQYYFL